MKSTIQLIPTTGMDQTAWLNYRKDGVGASEVGVIMGLSPYKSSIELFYEKIGEGLGFTVENLSMFLGKEQEAFIALLWEHWDGTVEGMINNYRIGRKVRRCKRVNAYARNPKWPWLFCSLDREINRHEGRENGALELKTIGGWEVDKWEAGLPPVYVVQVQTQCLVCEYEFGEIAILRDNRNFDVLEFEYNKSIGEGVVERTRIFWDKVVEAKKIVTRRFEAQRNFNARAVDELNAQLQELEPAPDGSDAYHNFLKEKFKIALPGEQKGTDTDLMDAISHRELNDRIKELKEGKQLHENRLKNVLRDGADRLDFGANGYVSWKTDANGTRRFLNKIKTTAPVIPDEVK